MIRIGIFSLDEVLPFVVYKGKKGLKPKKKYRGHKIKMGSRRYRVFATKGIRCVHCGIKGQYFALERHKESRNYHFNLYALKDGKEEMMTIDHIIPKSKGGGNDQKNLQPMCCGCNRKKGDKILDKN